MVAREDAPAFPSPGERAFQPLICAPRASALQSFLRPATRHLKMIRIFRVFISLRVLIAFFGDALATCAAYVAAAYLNPEIQPADYFWNRMGWQPVAVVTGLVLFALYFRDLYRDLQVRSRILMVQELFVVLGMMFLTEALFAYLTLGWSLPRRMLLTGSAFALPAIFLWRWLLSIAIRKQIGLRRVLFVGISPVVDELMEFVRHHPELGLAVLGYVEDGGAPRRGPGRLGSLGDLHAVIERERPDWLVIGRREAIRPDQVDEFLELRFAGMQIDDAAVFYERTRGRVCAAEIRPEAVLSAELRPNALNLRMQSMYSTGLALLACPLLIPLMAAIALAICAAGGRRIFAAETRVGLDGAPFHICFFAPQPGRLGRFLRRSGFDRLPQLWNVLRGQMSLVGPRADRPEYAARLNQAIPFYAQRTILLPGVTGWAQIHELIGEARANVLAHLEYDLYYLKNLSPLLDLFVILRWLRSGILFSQSRQV